MSREVLTLLLAAEGHTVEAAPSGDAALRRLHDGPPAPTLLLVDMQMPGLSGVDLARALRANTAPGTLLLGMSGTQPPRHTVESFDAFLLKPFRPQDLLAAAQQCRARQTPPSPPAASNQNMEGLPHPSSSEHAPIVAPDILDERIYQQLRETVPSPQLEQMYLLCLDDVRKRLDSMRRSAAEGDSDQFVRQAHAIKGGCGMLGARELYLLAARAEKQGLPTSALTGNAGVNPLDELAAACDRLQRILGTRT
jgi:CheY-like chemotaxis protein/HPt (histidine-containing phosphotransfer) domain-containing protein